MQFAFFPRERTICQACFHVCELVGEPGERPRSFALGEQSEAKCSGQWRRWGQPPYLDLSPAVFSGPLSLFPSYSCHSSPISDFRNKSWLFSQSEYLEGGNSSISSWGQSSKFCYHPKRCDSRARPKGSCGWIQTWSQFLWIEMALPLIVHGILRAMGYKDFK